VTTFTISHPDEGRVLAANGTLTGIRYIKACPLPLLRQLFSLIDNSQTGWPTEIFVLARSRCRALVYSTISWRLE
jgi:hypothetical protein